MGESNAEYDRYKEDDASMQQPASPLAPGQPPASPSPPQAASGRREQCLHCGKHNVAAAHFCTNCGHPLPSQPFPLPPYFQPRIPYPILVQPAPRQKKPWYHRFLSIGRAENPTATRLPSLRVQKEREQRRKLLERVRKQRYQQERRTR